MPDTRPPAPPEGYVLVPRVPTEAMHEAAVRTIRRCTGNADFPPRVWAAMLQAAPAICPDCHKPTGGPDGVHTCSPQANASNPAPEIDASAGRVDAEDMPRKTTPAIREALRIGHRGTTRAMNCAKCGMPLSGPQSTAHERTDMTTAAEAIEAIRLALDGIPTDETPLALAEVMSLRRACRPDALYLILDRMAELERANAWQPIETAPKDGTCYLATDGERQWVENTPPGCYPGVWELDKHGRWRGSTGDYEASFWRPLPSAPDAKEQA